MKRFYFIGVVVLSLFFLEIILFDNFIFFKIKPDLLFLSVIFFTVYMGLKEGIFSAIISGILLDAFSLNFGAMNLLAFVICAIAINYFKKYIYQETKLMIFVTMLAACLLNVMLDYCFGFFWKGVYSGAAFLLAVASEIILTAILAVPVFYYLKRCALKFYT